MIKYSVLMSVYGKDNPKYLMQAIDSMLRQTVKCDQFVIVEDGPLPDSLKEVIDDYKGKNKSLFDVVLLEKNIGLGGALDEGLKKCKNDLVARMDSDDISLPERCERQLVFFEKIPELSIIGTNIDEFDSEPDNIKTTRRVPSTNEEIHKFMRRRSPFNHPTVMYKKSEVLRCGGYGNVRYKEDLALFARMVNNGCVARNIDESLLLYRSNSDNYKRRRSWNYCKTYIKVQRDNYKKGYCSLFDLIYVTLGQLYLHFAPSWLMKTTSDRLLRERKK